MLAAICIQATAALLPPPRPAPRWWQRRQAIAGAAAGMLGAEATWRQAVAAAADDAALASSGLLPPGTIEEIEAGRIVVIKNWLPPNELADLRRDAEASFAAGWFKADALASVRRSPP